MPRVSRTQPPARPASQRQPRAVADRPSRWALLLRRQRRLIRPALGAAAVVLVVAAGASLLRSSRANASLDTVRARFGRLVDLKVQQVVLEGRANTPEPLLRAALGVSPGDPILGFSVEAARQRIESLSWVDHVTVERRLPGTIVVSLQEKRPFAIWQNQGRFQLIDRDGQVVTNEDIGAFGTLPLVVGAGAPEHAADLLDLLAKQPALQSRVAALVRVGERRWNLHLTSGTDVLLPEGAEAAAINRLAELEAGQALLERPLAVVDLRLPDRVVLRPQADAHADPHAPAPAAPAPPPRRAT